MTADPKDELRRLIAPDAGPGSMDEYLAVAAAGRILDAGWRPVPAEPLLAGLVQGDEERFRRHWATLSEWAETDPKRRLALRAALNPQQEEPDNVG